MQYRKLGQSELELSVIAFGAWAIGGWLWGGADKKDAIKAIETAVDNGMTSIDTAPVYGFGLSEELTGKAIKGKRSKVQLLTKFGMLWDEKKGVFFFKSKSNEGKDIDIYKYSAKDRVISDCEKSLKRLGTDYIDLFQIHWPDESTPVAETMEALEILIKQGKIRAAGVCNYSEALLQEAHAKLILSSEQVPFSMVNRGIEKDIIPFCLEKNIGILAYSPLQRGLLTGKMSKEYAFNEGDSRPTTLYYKEPNLSRILSFVDQLRTIANETGITVSQLVLNWTIQQPGISCALAGARNSKQVLDNVKAGNISLSEESMSRINSLVQNIKIEAIV
jgi:aryl-alcohol dehydrogenase-like predicted oxidoreductase